MYIHWAALAFIIGSIFVIINNKKFKKIIKKRIVQKKENENIH